MAILLPDGNNSSKAQVGDYVVTGGGIYYKSATGSEKISDLTSYLGKATTGSKEELMQVYQKVVAGASRENLTKNVDTKGLSNKLGNSASTSDAAEIFDSEENYDSFTNSITYDPTAAATGNIPNYSTSGNINMSNVVGYAIVGLVLIAVLDRLMK